MFILAKICSILLVIIGLQITCTQAQTEQQRQISTLGLLPLYQSDATKLAASRADLDTGFSCQGFDYWQGLKDRVQQAMDPKGSLQDLFKEALQEKLLQLPSILIRRHMPEAAEMYDSVIVDSRQEVNRSLQECKNVEQSSKKNMVQQLLADRNKQLWDKEVFDNTSIVKADSNIRGQMRDFAQGIETVGSQMSDIQKNAVREAVRHGYRALLTVGGTEYSSVLKSLELVDENQVLDFAVSVLGEVRFQNDNAAFTPGLGLTEVRHREFTHLSKRLLYVVEQIYSGNQVDIATIASRYIGLDIALLKQVIFQTGTQKRRQIISRLAAELSFSRVLEKGNLLSQWLQAGMTQTSLQESQVLLEDLQRRVKKLNFEISMMLQEKIYADSTTKFVLSLFDVLQQSKN